MDTFTINENLIAVGLIIAVVGLIIAAVGFFVK